MGWDGGAIDGTGGVLGMLQSLPPPPLHACDMRIQSCHHAHPGPPDSEDTGAQKKAQGPWRGVWLEQSPSPLRPLQTPPAPPPAGQLPLCCARDGLNILPQHPCCRGLGTMGCFWVSSMPRQTWQQNNRFTSQSGASESCGWALKATTNAF